MKFKTDNWEHARSLGTVKVDYTRSDIWLERSNRLVPDAPTTVVVLWNENCRYVGVSQCSSRDSYCKELGREIAAGRALKQMYDHVNKPDRNPDATYIFDETKEVLVFGELPKCSKDQIVNLIEGC